MNRCIGCGANKQTINSNQVGYVIKLDNDYCLRCFRIKNYNDLISQEINTEFNVDKLKKTFANEKSKFEIYYIIDIFDFDGSRVYELEKLIRQYDVNIIINKIDLLPKSIKLQKIRKYVIDVFMKSDLSQAKIILNSSLKLNFIDALLQKILKSSAKSYFVGASNVGKSTLINQLLAKNNLIPVIVASNYFNTTIEHIEIKLDSKHSIIDTPGISRSNSIANFVNHENFKKLFFKKEIKQITYQLKPNNAIFFDDFCWFEFVSESCLTTSFHVFTNSQIKMHRTNLKNVTNYYVKNNLLNLNLTQKINFQKVIYEFQEKQFDQKWEISISGLGWFNFKVNQNLKIIINIPKYNNDVLVKLRKPLT